MKIEKKPQNRSNLSLFYLFFSFLIIFSFSLESQSKAKPTSLFVEELRDYITAHNRQGNADVDYFTEAADEFLNGGYYKTNNKLTKWRHPFKTDYEFKSEKINLIRKIKENKFSEKHPNIFTDAKILGPSNDETLESNERLFISKRDFVELFNLISKTCYAMWQNEAIIIKVKPSPNNGGLNDSIFPLFTESVILPDNSKYEFSQHLSGTPSFGVRIFDDSHGYTEEIAYIRFHFVIEDGMYILYSDFYADQASTSEKVLNPHPIQIKGTIRESIAPTADKFGQIKCHLYEGKGVFYF